ncbi:UNVERIFIED_CONTAM: Tar (HIV-1) RNA binding protein 1 [Siphonaria sp. JEL0065]|nr:Tar (HIV-1) RNA binding protein 1 [Siphonaria sp. JEL0065]
MTGGGIGPEEDCDKVDWTKHSTTTIAKDLRSEPLFWTMVQTGLVSGDPVTEKYCLFLLKRVVDFSIKSNGLGNTTSEIFIWDAKQSPNLWNDYFIVFDILQESGAHLIEPILPKLSLFLNPSTIHPFWWVTLMIRGVHNNSAPMKKRILEYLISSTDNNGLVLKTLCGHASAEKFLLGTLIQELDAAFLYHVSGLGSFVSPFGEKVRGFVASVMKERVDKTATLKHLIKACVGFSSRVSSIYVLMGLSDFADKADQLQVLGPEDVLQFADMLLSDRAISVWTKVDARRLFSQLALNVTIKLSNPRLFTFKDVGHLLTVLGPSDSTANQYSLVQQWCSAGFGDDNRLVGTKWLVQETKNAITVYLKTASDGTELEIRNSELIATMTSFVSSHSRAEAIQPLLSRLENLQSSASYASAGTVNRVIFLLRILNAKVPSFLKDSLPLIHPQSTPFNVLRMYATVFHLTLSVSLSTGVQQAHQLIETLQDLETTAISRLESKGMTQSTLFTSYILLSIVYNIAHETSLHVFNTVFPTTKLLFRNIPFKKEVADSSVSNDPIPWSEIQNDLQIAQYSALHSLLKYASTATLKASIQYSALLAIVLASVSDQVGNTSNTSAPHLFIMMKSALDCLHNDLIPESLQSEICGFLKQGLQVVIENSGNAKHFLLILYEFSRVAFSRAVLRSVGDGRELRECVVDIFNAVFIISEHRISILQYVGAPCFKYWSHGLSSSDSRVVGQTLTSLETLKEIFVSFLLFGPLRDKNMDADRVDAVVAYNLRIPEMKEKGSWTEQELEYSNGTIEQNFNCTDYLIRVKANSILLSLNPASKGHGRVALSILDVLLVKHESGKLKAKFDNTLEHRLQIRLWCSIHLLLNHVDDASWVERFIKAIDAELIASSRYYVEWALMRVFWKFPETVDLVWSSLDRFDLRSTTTCSILSVLVHTLPHLPPEIQPGLYNQLFQRIMPWLTSNHFTIRLYAQYVAYTTWGHCSRFPHLVDIQLQHPALKSMVEFIRVNGDCIKHRQQAEKTFFVGESGFHPLLDLSVDFIFRGGLSAAGVTEEERISAFAFKRVLLDAKVSIPLFHDKERMLLWSSDPATVGTEVSVPEPVENNTDMAFQRKIEAWETMETDFDFSQIRSAADGRKRFPLIVVASLVSKAPNLGGLCRTCEIFNAELLLLPNLKVREDPAFLVTAVTSDKWMPLEELRPDPTTIIPYLTQKKSEGYSILGIEQATTSVSLDSFEFPEKCVLLLGMEKLGIPAVYLPLLDSILEIPQFGVIRSLNVHVSGALVLYSFAKQQARLRK